MNRIVKITREEIIVDHKKAAETINSACSRQGGMNVTGCCKCNDVLMFILEKDERPGRYNYVFAPFPEGGEDEITAEIDSRYFAGFRTITSFKAGKTWWALFAFDTQKTTSHSQ
jgi:hypothetical protein